MCWQLARVVRMYIRRRFLAVSDRRCRVGPVQEAVKFSRIGPGHRCPTRPDPTREVLTRPVNIPGFFDRARVITYGSWSASNAAAGRSSTSPQAMVRTDWWFSAIGAFVGNVSRLGQMVDPHLMVQNFQGRWTPGLNGLVHVAGWEPYDMTCTAKDMFPGLDPYRSCDSI